MWPGAASQWWSHPFPIQFFISCAPVSGHLAYKKWTGRGCNISAIYLSIYLTRLVACPQRLNSAPDWHPAAHTVCITIQLQLSTSAIFNLIGFMERRTTARGMSYMVACL